MKTIPLTQGKFAVVDDDDFDDLSKYSWRASWNENSQSYYAQRDGGRKKAVLMHRQIMKTPENMKCDHVNHDTLYNLKENLRNVTNSQNATNRKGANKNNALGVRGVKKNGSKFCAWIRDPQTRKTIYYKSVATIEEAAEMRKEAEIKYYGVFSGQ